MKAGWEKIHNPYESMKGGYPLNS